MNKTRTLLFFLIIMVSSTAMAQNWTTTGNALTATGKFGSTTSKDVNFISNNQTRMILTAAGNLAFGSDQSSLQFALPGSNPKPMMYLFPSGSNNTNRMIFAHSPGFPDYGLQYNDLSDKFEFVGAGTSVFNINLSGNIGASTTGSFGVGTSAPKAMLHILKGNSGITPVASSTLVTESTGDNFISVLASGTSKTGILFGTSSQDGAIVYNNPSVKSGMQFNTANRTQMTISGKGFVGIGTTSPQTELHVVHANAGTTYGFTHGFRLESANGYY